MKSETLHTAETRAFSLEVEKLTDRELQEAIYFKHCQIEKSNKKIRENMQFWFYLFISSAIISVVMWISGR